MPRLSTRSPRWICAIGRRSRSMPAPATITTSSRASSRSSPASSRRRAADVEVFVDTAPVMEKPLAAAAGLGWQGKHTVLVSRDSGTGSSSARSSRPRSCRPTARARPLRLLPALPRRVPDRRLPAPYRLDSRRCISYPTMFQGHCRWSCARGHRRPPLGSHDCLAVCPWNKFAEAGREARLRAARGVPRRRRWPSSPGSTTPPSGRNLPAPPVKRTGRDRFVRNVAIALGNSGDPGLATDAVRLLGDASPLVRAMAVWAIGRLLPKARIDALAAAHLPLEADPDVRGEWARARSRCASPHNSPHAEVRAGASLEARTGGAARRRQECFLRGSPSARTSG